MGATQQGAEDVAVACLAERHSCRPTARQRAACRRAVAAGEHGEGSRGAPSSEPSSALNGAPSVTPSVATSVATSGSPSVALSGSLNVALSPDLAHKAVVSGGEHE